MGLDQNLYAADSNHFEYSTAQEIGYWRKHPDLHNYIERLWCAAGKPNGDGSKQFNCIAFELTEDHIKTIITCSEKKTFGDSDGTEGFFFGATDSHHHEQTINIMQKALTMKQCGKHIFYNSWW